MLPHYEEEGAVVLELRGRSLRQGMASSRDTTSPGHLQGDSCGNKPPDPTLLTPSDLLRVPPRDQASWRPD